MHRNILSPECGGLRQKPSFYYPSGLLWAGNLTSFTWMILAGGVSCSCSHMEAWGSWELRGPQGFATWASLFFLEAWRPQGSHTTCLTVQVSSTSIPAKKLEVSYSFLPYSLNSHEVTLLHHSIGYNTVTNLFIVKKEIKLYVLIGYKFLEEQERCFHPLWKTISHSLPCSHNSHLFHIQNAFTCSEATRDEGEPWTEGCV